MLGTRIVTFVETTHFSKHCTALANLKHKDTYESNWQYINFILTQEQFVICLVPQFDILSCIHMKTHFDILWERTTPEFEYSDLCASKIHTQWFHWKGNDYRDRLFVLSSLGSNLPFFFPDVVSGLTNLWIADISFWDWSTFEPKWNNVCRKVKTIVNPSIFAPSSAQFGVGGPLWYLQVRHITTSWKEACLLSGAGEGYGMWWAWLPSQCRFVTGRTMAVQEKMPDLPRPSRWNSTGEKHEGRSRRVVGFLDGWQGVDSETYGELG